MNFNYLQRIPQFDKLYLSCCEAERYALTEANFSVAAARRSIEYLVKLIYSSAVTPYIEGMSVYDMITDPLFLRHMDDPELINEIHAIRRAGNRAVHEGNVKTEEAEQVLQQLYHVVGEVCVFLGLIDSYPDYDANKTQPNEKDKPRSEIELDISGEFVRLLHTHVAIHPSVSKMRTAVNVHTPLKERKLAEANVDPAANSKLALTDAEEYLKKQFLTVKMEILRAKSIMKLKAKNGKTIVLSVKSGCPQIGTVVDGEVVILPGIDYVLYAPDFRMGESLVSQLRVFTKDDFLQMWKSLDLIRMKVSSARVKELQKQYGRDYIVRTEDYADIISVQSFSNSGRKKPLVWAEFEERPLLTREGIEIIASALETNQ